MASPEHTQSQNQEQEIIEEKPCSQCGATLPRAAFGIRKRAPGGISSRCKNCRNRATVEGRKKDPAKAKMHRKLSARYRKENPDKVKATNIRSYAKTSSIQCEKARIRRIKEPEKHYARDRMKYAISSGRIIRPDTCEKCGVSCKPDGHHEDYSKPYEIRWLCRSCHFLLHRGKA